MSNVSAKILKTPLSLSKRAYNERIKLIRDAEELREAGKISDDLFYFAVKSAMCDIISRRIDTHFSDYIVYTFYPKVREFVEEGVS
jgi:hypothetical protein